MTDETAAPKPLRYGCWAGNPLGLAEDSLRCIESVMRSGEYISHQCRKKRGHGPGLRYCAQHNPETVAAKRAANHAAWKAEYDARIERQERPIRERAAMVAALREIAAGYNDARGLAIETLAAISESA